MPDDQSAVAATTTDTAAQSAAPENGSSAETSPRSVPTEPSYGDALLNTIRDADEKAATETRGETEAQTEKQRTSATETVARTDGTPDPADPLASVPEEWRDLVKQAQSEGYKSAADVQAAIAKQQADARAAAQQTREQSWLTQTDQQLRDTYQARIDAGEITPDVAGELYRRDLDLAKGARERQSQQITQEQSSVRAAVADAAKAEPLLTENDGFLGHLAEALHLSGVASVKDALPELAKTIKAVGNREYQRGIAETLAGIEKNKTAPPTLPAGGGTAGNSDAGRSTGRNPFDNLLNSLRGK